MSEGLSTTRNILNGVICATGIFGAPVVVYQVTMSDVLSFGVFVLVGATWYTSGQTAYWQGYKNGVEDGQR